jgi:hypothetical protein
MNENEHQEYTEDGTVYNVPNYRIDPDQKVAERDGITTFFSNDELSPDPPKETSFDKLYKRLK